MINPDQIHADLAHLAQIAPGLFRRTDVESISVWLEWPVSDAFDKKLAVAFKEELGDGADARLGRHARRVCARRASVQNCRAGPLACTASERRGQRFPYRLRSASPIAAAVRSKSCSVWASDMKP